MYMIQINITVEWRKNNSVPKHGIQRVISPSEGSVSSSMSVSSWYLQSTGIEVLPISKRWTRQSLLNIQEVEHFRNELNNVLLNNICNVCDSITVVFQDELVRTQHRIVFESCLHFCRELLLQIFEILILNYNLVSDHQTNTPMDQILPFQDKIS